MLFRSGNEEFAKSKYALRPNPKDYVSTTEEEGNEEFVASKYPFHPNPKDYSSTTDED